MGALVSGEFTRSGSPGQENERGCAGKRPATIAERGGCSPAGRRICSGWLQQVVQQTGMAAQLHIATQAACGDDAAEVGDGNGEIVVDDDVVEFLRARDLLSRIGNPPRDLLG